MYIYTYIYTYIYIYIYIYIRAIGGDAASARGDGLAVEELVLGPDLFMQTYLMNT